MLKILKSLLVSSLLHQAERTSYLPSTYIVAKRSLGTGLTAAGVTSSWTWSTTLLSSCTVAYEYGVAGSFFYAACNSTQIMVFSNLAIVSFVLMVLSLFNADLLKQSKRKAPNARTFLEIIRVRYGTVAHFSFMFFSLASNILVVSSILIGGAAAINSLTGMSVYASLWLLPLSVTSYTMRGGLRATILTDYVSFMFPLGETHAYWNWYRSIPLSF